MEKAGDNTTSELTARANGRGKVLTAGIGHFVHRDRFGRVIDRWTDHNLVVNGALDAYLDARLKGNSSVSFSTWYMGLILGESTAAASDFSSTDTGATVSWSESTHYSEGTRVKWESGSVSGGSVSNSASTSKSFSINTSTTLGGMFLVTESAKGTAGSTDAGVLHGQVAFSQTRSLSSGDTLEVTYTATMAFSST